MAPQLTAMKGRAARALCAWISRAASSLPLPDSPEMAIGAIERASRPIWARRPCMAGESPIRRLPLEPPAVVGALAPSAAGARRRAERTIRRKSSSTTGLET